MRYFLYQYRALVECCRHLHIIHARNLLYSEVTDPSQIRVVWYFIKIVNLIGGEADHVKGETSWRLERNLLRKGERFIKESEKWLVRE